MDVPAGSAGVGSRKASPHVKDALAWPLVIDGHPARLLPNGQVEIDPDFGASGDAYMRGIAPTTNFGADVNIFAGDISDSSSDAARSPIKFDVSSIPADAMVSPVTFKLWEDFAANSGGTENCAFNLQRLLRNWDKAQVTWNVYSTGNSWTTAGAGSDGNDRAAAISASVTLDSVAANAFVSWTGTTLTDDVQKFVNGTYPNYGWLLSAPTAEYQGVGQYRFSRFCSSDHGTPSQRPVLTVPYTLPSVAMFRAPMWGRY